MAQLWLAVLTVFAPLVSGLFFSLPSKAQECFSVNVKEKRMLLTGSFEASGAKEGLLVTITSPEEKDVFTSKEAHGEISFKAAPGKYRLCFTSQVSKPQVLSFDVRVRSEFDWDIETDKAATKKQTDKVEDLVRRLLDRVLDVQDQQHHAITREQIYRATAESTHDRVIWWTVIKFLVLAFTSLSQVWYLRSLFEVKQIVSLSCVL